MLFSDFPLHTSFCEPNFVFVICNWRLWPMIESWNPDFMRLLCYLNAMKTRKPDSLTQTLMMSLNRNLFWNACLTSWLFANHVHFFCFMNNGDEDGSKMEDSPWRSKWSIGIGSLVRSIEELTSNLKIRLGIIWICIVKSPNLVSL